MTWHPYQLYSVRFSELHEEFVAVPDQFRGDLVVAQSFNHGLAVRKNVDVFL
jgi:hypothetical protein